MPVRECEFLTLFERRRDVFRRLLELSRAQMQLLDVHDYTQLLALQAEKQRLLAGLDDLDAGRPPLKDRWRRERDALSSADRAACEAALDEQEALVAELIHEERASAETLEQQLDETRRQLAALDQGQRTRTRYQAAAGHPSPRSLDLDL